MGDKKHINRTMMFGFGVIAFVGLFSVLEATSTPWVLMNIVGFIIVFGGLVGAVLVMQPFDETVELFKSLFATMYGERLSPLDTVTDVIGLSEKLRLGVSPAQIKAKDETLQEAIGMLASGLKVPDIKRCIELRVENHETELTKDAGFLITLSKIAPAFGLVGTLLGMILLLQAMGGDGAGFESVGPAMAIALCATLYGVAAGNMIFYPWAEHLGYLAHNSLLRGQIINEGLSMIFEHRHPVQIRETLRSYLGKKDQEKLLARIAQLNQQQSYELGAESA